MLPSHHPSSIPSRFAPDGHGCFLAAAESRKAPVNHSIRHDAAEATVGARPRDGRQRIESEPRRSRLVGGGPPSPRGRARCVTRERAGSVGPVGGVEESGVSPGAGRGGRLAGSFRLFFFLADAGWLCCLLGSLRYLASPAAVGRGRAAVGVPSRRRTSRPGRLKR